MCFIQVYSTYSSTHIPPCCAYVVLLILIVCILDFTLVGVCQRVCCDDEQIASVRAPIGYVLRTSKSHCVQPGLLLVLNNNSQKASMVMSVG